MKMNYHLPKGSKKSLRNARNTCSNDGNMVVEIGDTTLPTPQTQNQQRSFYESFKRRTVNTFASEKWDFKHAIGHRLKLKKDT
jgi:hypothetical protein